jgi:hypothetical protein
MTPQFLTTRSAASRTIGSTSLRTPRYPHVLRQAATGEYTLATLAARAWETMVGGALGVAVVLLLEPLPRLFQRPL